MQTLYRKKTPANIAVIVFSIILLVINLIFAGCQSTTGTTRIPAEKLKNLDLPIGSSLELGDHRDKVILTRVSENYYETTVPVVKQAGRQKTKIINKPDIRIEVNQNSGNKIKDYSKDKPVKKDKSQANSNNKEKISAGFSVPWWIWLLAVLAGIALARKKIKSFFFSK